MNDNIFEEIVAEPFNTSKLKCVCGTPQDDGECMFCAIRDCPFDEPFHYHHDGCPACYVEEMKNNANK